MDDQIKYGVGFVLVLLLSIAAQIGYLIFCFCVALSIYFAQFALFMGLMCSVWYYALFVFLAVIHYKLHWSKNLALIIGGLPMLVVLWLYLFSDISPKANQVEDYPNQKLTYPELPVNVQEFFTEWNGKSINNNRVASSGYHPLGHEHISFDAGYFKSITTGVGHKFNMGTNKLTIGYFVKNAFYLDGDILYYSSDWTNMLPLSFANYYSVDLFEEYHPVGSNVPHEFNQRILDNNPKVQETSLKYPVRKQFSDRLD